MPNGKPKPPERRSRKVQPTPKPKPMSRRSDIKPVDPSDVSLESVKGTPGRGGRPWGEAWRIEVCGQRAGVIFINFINEPPIGPHASIQIYLNQKSQGRHIGRTAYKLACKLSRFEVIYAHMRKSNVASRRAAEEAGFVDATPPGHLQLIMIYRRNCN